MVLGNVDRWLDDARRSPSPGGSVLLLVVTAGLILATIGGFLSWRGYQDRAQRARERVVETAVEAARAAGQFFEDRISLLESIAEMPSLRGGDPSVISPILDAVSRGALGLGGGIGWVDASGFLQVESGVPPQPLPVDVSDRDYVRMVLDGAAPYISHALTGHRTGLQLVVIAVPTFSGEEVSGMLVASVPVDDLLGRIPALAPPRTQLRVVDRAEAIILENGRGVPLGEPANPGLLDPDGAASLIGLGLEGDLDQIIGIGRVERPGWVMVAEQARVLAVAGARNRLFAEIGVVVALMLLTSGAAFVAAQRLNASHGLLMRRTRDLGILDLLGERMAAASEPRDVALTALDVFAEVFESGAVMIGLIDEGGDSMRVLVADSHSGVTEMSLLYDNPSVLADAHAAGRTLLVDSREYRGRYLSGPETPHLTADASAGVMAARFSGRLANGAIAVVIPRDFPPPTEDLELLEAMALLLPGSLGRAVATERERMASRVFQQALLPRDNIGIEVPIQRAVRYLPAVGDVEVGGDWYDLWMIDDDTVGVVVGDVVGRGVEAAAAMGQLRSALRATVAAANSTGEALTHLDDLTGQITGAPSATVLLGSLDMGSGVVTMASAGHLPPLVASGDGVSVMYEVRGIPIGFVSQRAKRASVAIRLRPEETLVLYSDGLVERREETIDQGIARLAEALAVNSHMPLEALADALIESCMEPDNTDDVALVCVRMFGDIAEHFTCLVELDEFDKLHKALRKWLRGHRYPKPTIAAILARVTGTVAVVSEVTGDEHPGEIMVEVDRGEGVVTVEHRRLSAIGDPSTDAFVLGRWPGGELGPRGPRLRFAVPDEGSAD